MPATDSSMMPLSSVLADRSQHLGLAATVRFVGPGRYLWSRVALHAPFALPAVASLALVFLRNSSGHRLVEVIIAAVITLVIGAGAAAISPKPSFGSRLCLIALPARAVSLLGLTARHVAADCGGRVPRYPLLITDEGLSIGAPFRGGGVLDTLLPLRSRSAGVELETTRRGRLATCTLAVAGERVSVAVRGRLALA